MIFARIMSNILEIWISKRGFAELVNCVVNHEIICKIWNYEIIILKEQCFFLKNTI